MGQVAIELMANLEGHFHQALLGRIQAIVRKVEQGNQGLNGSGILRFAQGGGPEGLSPVAFVGSGEGIAIEIVAIGGRSIVLFLGLLGAGGGGGFGEGPGQGDGSRSGTAWDRESLGVKDPTEARCRGASRGRNRLEESRSETTPYLQGIAQTELGARALLQTAMD